MNMESAQRRPALDVGRPQRAVYELEIAGQIGHEVLDVGCGIGEQALWLAARGHVVCGVDTSEVAVARAQRQARRRQLPPGAVAFVPGELAAVERLGRRFDCVLDVGDLHRVAAAERAEYAASLRRLLRPGGRLYLWCFGDHERALGGPPRVTQAELRAAFAVGWGIEEIAAARLESHTWPGGAHAWLLVATPR
jgi:cyclopropane fatty-acyl-phospholipid synthase-like methyltransferase